MASIKCKACGRGYNYREHEICPKCGAYNRPPHRMRVGFDKNGSVELLTEKEFLREAELFDARDDVCAEGQARKVRAELIDSETLDALGKQLNKWGSRMETWWAENSKKSSVPKDSPLRDRKKSNNARGKAVATVVVVVSIFASLFGTIMESCESNRVQIAPDYPSASTEVIAPTEVYWSEEHYQRILESWSVSQEVGLTEGFEWYGGKYWVGDWQLTSGAGDNVLIASVNGEEFPEEKLYDCFLLWVDWDGTEWTYAPEKFQNGALIFRDLHTDTIPEGTLCWIVFNDFDENGNWRGTTAVSLVEHDGYFSDAPYDDSSTEAIALWSDEQIKDALTRHGVTELVEMGTVFDWEGLDVWVSGWEMTSDNTVMVIGLNTSGVLPETATQRCFLVWGDSPEMTWAEFTVSYRNGALIFDELYTTLYEETKVWLLCENYEKDETTGEPFCTGITAVTLN